MITGNKSLSPSNNADLSVLTDSNNAYGENIKVVIISRGGRRGLDFKKYTANSYNGCVWYNMNRVQQIIGEASAI
jgi:hypothetical protein